jgi:hypothetical protein
MKEWTEEVRLKTSYVRALDWTQEQTRFIPFQYLQTSEIYGKEYRTQNAQINFPLPC